MAVPVGIARLAPGRAVAARRPSGAREVSSWRIAPEPRWVVPPPAPSARREHVDESVLEYLVDDNQVRLSEGTVEFYRHVRFHPRSPDQVERGSQLEIEFNPAFQHLVFHHAHVERDGRSIPALNRRDVKVVQREKDFEARIYDGSLSALIFLRDVRVGDVVDYAYSVEGSNPLLASKYVTRFALADETFTAVWRWRIVAPAARPLTVKAHATDLGPTITTDGDRRDYRWERHDVAPIEPEDHLPAWFVPEPWIEVSEFGSWAEVAAMFAPMYRGQGEASPELAALIATLRAKSGTDEDRLLEAVRFVQDDIRYLGIELGVGAQRPFDPATVLARRFGDCKDKSFLLVSILAVLGFDAKPALVNTSRLRALDDSLPSPFAFDHAIVRVTVDGKTHFIDPTVSHQRGPLSVRRAPYFERALIVGPDTRALISMPRPLLTEPDYAVREIFTVAADNRAADLEVETTYRYGEAERMRGLLAVRTRKELGRDYLNYYSRGDTTVTQTSDPQTEDDERRNVITLRERYHIGSFWRDGRRELDTSALNDYLGAPRIRLRRMPYALQFPLNALHETIVLLPAQSHVEPENCEIGDEHLRLRFKARATGKALAIRYELQALKDSVPPDKAQRFFQTLDEIRRRSGYLLQRDSAAVEASSSLARPTGVAGLVAWGLVPLAVLVAGARGLWRWSKRRGLKSGRRFASGDAAATAIEVASKDALGARVAELRCSCGGRYHSAAPEQDQQVRYDGRTLVLRMGTCRDCSRQRSIFFAIRGD